MLLFRSTSPPTLIDKPDPAPGLVITPALDTLTLAVPPVPILSVSSTPRFLRLLLITPVPIVVADNTSVLLTLKLFPLARSKCSLLVHELVKI